MNYPIGGLCDDPQRVPFTSDVEVWLGGLEHARVFVLCGQNASTVGTNIIRAMRGLGPELVDYSLETELGA